jgi:hypothetical protein
MSSHSLRNRKQLKADRIKDRRFMLAEAALFHKERHQRRIAPDPNYAEVLEFVRLLNEAVDAHLAVCAPAAIGRSLDNWPANVQVKQMADQFFIGLNKHNKFSTPAFTGALQELSTSVARATIAATITGHARDDKESGVHAVVRSSTGLSYAIADIPKPSDLRVPIVHLARTLAETMLCNLAKQQAQQNARPDQLP